MGGVTAFRDLRIQNRLILAMLGFITLMTVFLWYYLPKKQLEHATGRLELEAKHLAVLLASGMATAMEFEDEAALSNVLSWAQADGRIKFIIAFKNNGQRMNSAYGAQEAEGVTVEPSLSTMEVRTESDALHVFAPVRRDGQKVGALALGLSLNDLQREISATQITTITVCALLMLMGLVFALLVGRTIARPILRLTEVVNEIGAGRLDRRIAVDSRDEVGQLGMAFNDMAARLEGALAAEREAAEAQRRARQDVMETAEKLSSVSNEILASTTEQASGAQEQAAAVAETVASVNEVAQTAEEAARRASVVSTAGRETIEAAKAGRQAIEESISGMGVVKEQVGSIAEGIVALAEKAQAIGDIIATVNEIAEQTNMLAFNAAIEASRAGEHGRGFSVVASEVKALASESKKATAQIRQILVEIQRATNTAVVFTEEGTKRVNHAVSVVNRAGETIKQLVATVDDAVQTTSQIAASADQQATGILHIHTAMKNINEVASRNLASTRQAERAALDLNSLAGQLRQRLTTR